MNPPQLPTPSGQQAPAPPGSSSTSASGRQAASATPDHAAAYYHYMLARRYAELAGIYNRSDYIERAISEYRQAIQADPTSLFLKVELAGLYWRLSRIADAVKEAQDVLKVNPDDVDAHRLLARIYAQSLGQPQSNAGMAETLLKAIKQYQAVTRLDPSDLESALILGRLYKLNNQPAKAEQVFNQVLTNHPDSRAAVFQLAQLYGDKGEYHRTIQLLKKIPDDEMDPGLLGMLGYAEAQVGDYGSAETAYQKALQLDPNNQDIRRAYAEALMASGKVDEAHGQLQQVLKSDPEDAATYVSLAKLDREEGHFNRARKNLDRAKGLAPDSVEVSYQLAILDYRVGDDNDAITLLNQLLQQTQSRTGQYTLAEAGNRAAFLQLLGQIYRSEEKYDQALAEFRQITALGGPLAPQGEGLIVETLQLAHRRAQAEQELNAAIKKYPKDRALKLLRASYLGEQGHLNRAINILQKMLTGAPTDRQIYLAMAQVYSQDKRYPAAEAAVQKALALSPKPADQEYALFVLGSVYDGEKKYDLAEQTFKKVLSQDPLNDAADNYLGYMLADRGIRLQESLEYIKKAVALQPNNGAYLDSLGWAYYKMKRYDQARAPLEKAVELISDDSTIRMHMGYVYFKLGMKEQAREQWEKALKFWHHSLSSDFSPKDAAKLRKELRILNAGLGKKKPGESQN
jgi:tetratricopeptide (TPR) repeat protein